MRGNTIRHLFVYGTLRRGSPHPQAAWLASQAVYKGRATLAGRLLHLGDHPGLVPASDASERVQGDLYELPESPSLLEELDRYEGCNSFSSQPQQYCRIVCTASDEDEVRVWCWAYLYQLEPETSLRIVSGDWLRG